MQILTDNARLMFGDCLERLNEIPAGSVDMALCDPPYGVTDNKWDAVISLVGVWAHLDRIIKPGGAVVMTAVQPFTTTLISSNRAAFKYCWYLDKPNISGFQNAKKRPLTHIEDVVVFGAKTYRPQGLVRVDRKRGGTKTKNYGTCLNTNYTQTHTNYPRQLLGGFAVENRGLHPTQKPVGLMEYLIKTYTDVGDTVLDFTMGSGTTGVAAANTGRKFIGIELNAEYFGIAAQRVLEAYNAKP